MPALGWAPCSYEALHVGTVLASPGCREGALHEVPIQQEIEPGQLYTAVSSSENVYAAPAQAAKNGAGGPEGLLSRIGLRQMSPSTSSSHVIPG